MKDLSHLLETCIRIDCISCFFTRRVVLSLLVAELFLSCFV